MNSKIFTGSLVILGIAIATSAISPRAARAQNAPQLVRERGTALQLSGVEARTTDDWNFAVGEGQEVGQSDRLKRTKSSEDLGFSVGEGREELQQTYEIRQTNNFFESLTIETPLSPDELYNRNNNVGDPLPEPGEVEIFRF